MRVSANGKGFWNEEVVELAAILVPSTANPQDLDAITAHIASHAEIESATWTVSTES